MTLKAIPLLTLALILYNIVVLFTGSGASDDILSGEIFHLTMASGGVWKFTVGHLIVFLGLVLLGIEVIKATYTRGSGLADQAFSMIIFVIFIIEFLLIEKAATSVFFLLTIMSLIDIIAGSIIGIRTARRDIGFGNNE